MLNPYIIILSLFIIAGFITTLWGWHIIAKGRETLRWPSIEGTIEESTAVADEHDLLPHVLYSYRIDEKLFQKSIKFPSDISPTKEFSDAYLKKYPIGKRITVHYQADKPENATIEPGIAQGDWLVFALGLGMTTIGIASLLISN